MQQEGRLEVKLKQSKIEQQILRLLVNFVVFYYNDNVLICIIKKRSK